ncbi:unnamed protein product [Cuscuta campestris]|uniref:BED-type domain-containing protein n=2 Tax=Cuscuta sect. Cleistogrammica TaxID=1824901 RepID=A0A484LSI0_9ASTE|nr:unnamed protein product [Cuscuta campestris]
MQAEATAAPCISSVFPMAEGNDENAMEVAYHTDANVDANTDANTDERQRREGKSRSVVWQHFIKLMKEDGTYEKCKCNHCHKVFACSSRSGTTNLLRHLTEGGCPVVKLDKKGTSERKTASLPWKYEHQTPIEVSIDMHEDLLPDGLPYVPSNGEFVGPSYGKASKTPPRKSLVNGGDAWTNELRACLGKLNKLINDHLPKGASLKTSLDIGNPDTSIFGAIKCLNELEDIPESSTMYLDALDVLRVPEERECFVCLNPEPRRRWLQRMLHRQYPLIYNDQI